MVKLEYDKGGCVGCPADWGCLGRNCPHCWETIMICDVCEQESDELYRFDDTDYCEECKDKLFTRISFYNVEDYANG